MTLKEKVVAILTERSFEVRDGSSKMEVIESVDFDQIAMDILDVLKNDYNFELEES
jgi:hypothetical protein